MTDTVAQTYTDHDVDQCVAQVRKWAGSGDNGWTPTREQVTVLADEVERLRAAIEDAWSDGYNEGHSDGHASASEDRRWRDEQVDVLGDPEGAEAEAVRRDRARQG